MPTLSQFLSKKKMTRLMSIGLLFSLVIGEEEGITATAGIEGQKGILVAMEL
jgi:hypothetical protein